eukprot:3757989-Prymnesium_polylepis.1
MVTSPAESWLPPGTWTATHPFGGRHTPRAPVGSAPRMLIAEARWTPGAATPTFFCYAAAATLAAAALLSHRRLSHSPGKRKSVKHASNMTFPQFRNFPQPPATCLFPGNSEIH